jgi:hypothetical protein
MNKVGKIAAFALLAITGIFVVGFVTMQLWNWLVPVLFNGPVVTIWQALGLLLLSKLLFWGFGGGKGHAERKRAFWAAQMRGKFSSMTPEEREIMKQKMKDKWCAWDEKRSSWNEKRSTPSAGSSND